MRSFHCPYACFSFFAKEFHYQRSGSVWGTVLHNGEPPAFAIYRDHTISVEVFWGSRDCQNVQFADASTFIACVSGCRAGGYYVEFMPLCACVIAHPGEVFPLRFRARR
jgi:hypothetical protein